MYNTSDKPAISEGWRIRNDIRNILLYSCSVEKDRVKVLPPFVALVISLFNGKNTVEEIKRTCLALVSGDTDREEINTALDSLFKALFEIEGLFTFDGNISPSLSKGHEYFIPDLKNYKFPAYRLERPLSVMVAYTNRCGCDCRYCYAERKTCEEADLETWKHFFDDLKKNEIYMIDIAGGDIFSRSDAMDILKELSERDFTFFLSTKRYITEKDAEKLAELNIGVLSAPPYIRRRVQLSVDSANDETLERLIRVPGYLGKVTQTAKNLIKFGISPRIKCVLSAYNAAEPLKIIDHFSNIGVKTFEFVSYTRSYYRHEDTLFLTKNQKLEIHEMEETIKTRRQYKDLDISFVVDTSEGLAQKMTCENWAKRAVCRGGRSNMIIQPNGDVLLCDQAPHTGQFIVGNVFKQGVMGAWNSSTLINFIYPDKNKFSNSVCFECAEFDECMNRQGYCYRDALFYYGSIYDAPPECPWQNKPVPRKA